VNDLEVARRAARAGADIIRRAFGKATSAEWKGDANPVTLVDQEAETAILGVLAESRPGDATLAEESGGQSFEEGRVWIVDPLDGTVNFLHGIPQLAVSVALWIDGRAEVADIIDVCRAEEFTAAQGRGAWLGETPITVSPQTDLGASLVATGFPYDRNVHGRRYAAIMGEVLVRVRGIRRIGSAALDLAWVACGRYEGYWEFGIQPWDAAAGVLLVEEGGGRISDLEGDPHRLDDAAIVASNASIHEPLLAALHSA